MIPVTSVQSLTYYPVKGCTGTAVSQATLNERGLEHDRSFMVVNAGGAALSQRKRPVMATVRPRLLDDGAVLVLSAPGVQDFKLEVLLDGPRRTGSHFGNVWEGIDQGAEVAQWFSTVLDEPCWLLRVPADHQRVTDGEVEGTAAFADAHALLLTSVASLDGLNERIADGGGTPVPMNRFRPNIVVSGWSEPHDEDEVRQLSFGSGDSAVRLAYAKQCVRCAVPMVDQETGRKAGPEPIKTLSGYRRYPDGGVTFGIKLVVLNGGTISVGDPITMGVRSS